MAIADQQTDNKDDDGNDSKDMRHPDSMIKQMATISAALCAIYQWAPESTQSEIARVLGNLTRSLDARVAVFAAGGLQFLLKNLTSNDWDIVETSCGVLVNMLSDWERRAPFRELRGPLLLRDVLQRSAMKHDWLLALIACQVRFATFETHISITPVHSKEMAVTIYICLVFCSVFPCAGNVELYN